MEYREFGKTGKKVSFIGFGGMRFENAEDTEKSAETVLAAWNKGVNYFDTAPKYFRGKSEEAFGIAFKEMQKSGKTFYTSTKSQKADAAGFRTELETSLKRMNLSKIDFFHVWYVVSMDDYKNRKSGGAVAGMLKAKEEGLIDHLCISVHVNSDEIKQIIDDGFYEGITLGYSAVNFFFREEGLAYAAQKGLGIALMNPLGGGLIPANPEYFDFLKTEKDSTVLEAAVRFLQADNRISTILIGARNEADIESAVKASESFPYGSAGIYADKKAALPGLLGSKNELCTTCGYCDVCPENIPVWKFAETANSFYIKTGQSIPDRLRFFWAADPSLLEKCTKCLACEEACTQHLPLMKRFDMIRKALKEISK